MDDSTEKRPEVTVTGTEAPQPAETEGTLRASDAEAATPAASGRAEEGAAASSEFLRSLITAMRSVAESSRDSSLTELRAAVEARVEEIRASAATQADELRRLADRDIDAVGEWERAEIERIRAEAEHKREARRMQLDQQLAEHEAASQRHMEETRRRLADHERELAEFFARLETITDPAAFVAAAKQMPRAPELSSPAAGAATPVTASPSESAEQPAEASAVEAATTTTTDEPAWPEPTGGVDTRLAERLAELDALSGAVGGEPAEATAEKADAEAATAEPVTAEAATGAAQNGSGHNGGGEASTAIVVKGLSSFGAITSFKQALERIDGIRGVTLSLGPTGEFVYRASHAAEFDVAGAIRSIEGPSATIDESEGSLLVTVNRGR